MLEELAMRNHASILPTLLLVLNVLVPKTVIVVVVVARNYGVMLIDVCSLDIVDFCVVIGHEVDHDLVGGGFELVLVDVLFLTHNDLTLFHSFVVFRAADEPLDQLAGVELCALFIIHASCQHFHNSFVVYERFVFGSITECCLVDFVEPLLCHHLFA